ncbi:MAG: WHG domain-containing protein [Alphaproteobacteria bacterium]|nr:WHG domain-containing protein [Alphaproteobacteria bacterium]
MARRKDHTPEALKALIRQSAQKLIVGKGLGALTARNLAKAIGYTPGTIYNFYRDMDALVTEVNYHTLDELEQNCLERIADKPKNFKMVQALAHAYVDFAHQHRHAWETLFSMSRTGAKLPKSYEQKLAQLFGLIERVLQECLALPMQEAKRSARLLWAALHGITVLTLDGRLRLIDATPPHEMIDDLLKKYFAQSITHQPQG